MRRHELLTSGLLFALLAGCTDPSGLGVDPHTTAASQASLFGGGASISLEKSTNGQDADESPGPSILPGDPVVWEYRVRNTGAEALTAVYVMDDMEGFICTIGTLAVGQEEVCSLEREAQLGAYANEGSAHGRSLLFSVESRDWSHYIGEDPGNQAPEAQAVDIQIKPGGSAPCINPSSKGRTPVAILASLDFDPLAVDPHTILAGGTTSPVRWGRGGEDVNRDGLSDLVIHFRTQQLGADGLLQDGEELVISGETLEGESFTGSDMVRLVRGPFCK